MPLEHEDDRWHGTQTNKEIRKIVETNDIWTRKNWLTFLLALSVASSVKGQQIEEVGASIEILPSTYYGNVAWDAWTYTVNRGDMVSWGEELPCLGIPDDDPTGTHWYQPGYNQTDGEFSWEQTSSPYFSEDYYNGLPAYRWTKDFNVADIYIRRTFSIKGELPETVYLACGHDDGESQFYINGVLVHATDTKWNNAEYILLSEEQKALLRTDGTDNLLAVHVHNNYGGAFADCGLYGKTSKVILDANLPFGYDKTWTARLLFNSEGGYSYNETNMENPIHGWSKLYEASSSDEYTIQYPTASQKTGNAIAQFRTPITLYAGHTYSLKVKLSADQNVGGVRIALSETDGTTEVTSKSTTLTAGKVKTVSISSFDGKDISNLQVSLAAATTIGNTSITLSSMSIYDITEERELWDGTSYFNYCHYKHPETGERIKDMNITGRRETLSWTTADFDDSMWQEAPMPIGNHGYMSEVKTIWQGEENTNYWIRRDFELTQVPPTSKYLLRVCHDDSYSVYVNGHLVDSSLGWTNGKAYTEIEIPYRFLNVGRNVIATYIQQNWGGRFYDCSMRERTDVYEEADLDADPVTSLMATEVEVSNIDQIVDYSFNYGAWIELYNKSDKRVSLDYLYISDDSTQLDKCMIQKNGVVNPHSYKCLFFDHNSVDGVYGETADKQIPFKLSNDGGSIYLSEDGKEYFLKIDYPEGIMRCSWARTSLDSEEWGYNGTPTPGAANSEDFASERLQAPAVDTDSRLFDTDFDVCVSFPSGSTLVYTTDGTAPTKANGTISEDGKFHIANTTTLRLRLFGEGYLPSEVVTRSYIRRDRDYYLPVICVTTDAENLYGDSIGVYVDGVNGVAGRNHGKSNINMDWERPVNFEYLTADGRMVVNQEAEFCISGGWSRHYAPSSFKIKAKTLYEGRKSLDYPFFDRNPHKRYKQLLIRNGGNDNDSPAHGRVRDAITQEVLTSSGFYIDAQYYQPVHVFFNGDYIGMLNLREPNNKYNGTASYGYDDDEMDAFEYSNGYFQMAGTKDAFDEWYSLAASATDSATYSMLKEKVDIDEVINYFAAITYIGCTDWICNNNNVKGYRSLPDGKFHLTLLDQDWGWGNQTAIKNLSEYNGNELARIFNMMRKNGDFARQFVDAYCILGGSVFTPTRCTEIGDSICNMVEKALAMEGKQPWTSYNEQKGNMTGSYQRNARMLALKSVFSLSNGMKGKFQSNIPQASFMLNGLPVPGAQFDGTLFAPIRISAGAPAGYVFDGWHRTTGTEGGKPTYELVSTDRELEMEEDADFDLVAMFHREADEAPVRINEVSAGNDIYVSDHFKRDDWMELYNTTDKDIDIEGMYLSDNANKPQKYKIQPAEGISTIVPANGRLLVWADGREQKSQLHAPFKLANADGSMVTLQSADGSWKDVIRYDAHDGKETFGRYPDGANHVSVMSVPTIGKSNILSTYDQLGEMPLPKDSTCQMAYSLSKGWNWFSHNLSSGIGILGIGDGNSEIRSQWQETVKEGDSWNGELKVLLPATGYKIHADESHELTINGLMFDSEQPVAVSAGWNWIGCPLANATVLGNALADYRASEGDMVVGHTGFATYHNGEWVGTLASVRPGEAYMLKCGMGQAFRWNPLSVNKKSRRRYAAEESPAEGEWTTNCHLYADVMCMIATVVDGERTLAGEGFRLAAFCGDECRGVATEVDGLLYMTIYGDETDEITFRIEDGQGEVYLAREAETFNALSVHGTPSTPYELHLEGNIDMVSKPTTGKTMDVRYYTVSGLRTSTPGNAKGIRLEQTVYEDGNTATRKVMK